MKKRKYEAKTGEEWLQHVSRYLYENYWYGDQAGWINENVEQAQRIIASLIKKVGDA
jgi:hypothetical protein